MADWPRQQYGAVLFIAQMLDCLLAEQGLGEWAGIELNLQSYLLYQRYKSSCHIHSDETVGFLKIRSENPIDFMKIASLKIRKIK